MNSPSECLLGPDDGLMRLLEPDTGSHSPKLLAMVSQDPAADQPIQCKEEPPSPAPEPDVDSLFGSNCHSPVPGEPDEPEVKIKLEDEVTDKPLALIEWHPEPAAATTQEKPDDDDSMFVDVLPDPVTTNADSIDDSLFRTVAPPPYAWANLTDESEQAAKIVEEAVDVALQAGQQAVHLLRAAAHRQGRVKTEHWVKEFDAVRTAHKEFKVHVGVSGATGAGKTTIINALLDFDELLPSGSDGAATATACVVHLNQDPRPGKTFRAAVRFKTRDEIRAWLKPIRADVRGYYRAMGEDVEGEKDKMGGKEDDSDEDFLDGEDGEEEGGGDVKQEQSEDEENEKDNIADKDSKFDNDAEEDDEEDDDGDDGDDGDDDWSECDESELRDKLVPVTAVFGVGLEEMRRLSVDELLCNEQHPITRFLGTTKYVYADNKNDFARVIRPYLDCSPLPDEELPGYGEGGGDGSASESESEEDDDNNGNNERALIVAATAATTDDDDAPSLANMLLLHGRRTTRKTSSRNRQVWPLVSHVDLYVPSALLAGGIVLEDLPGLSDAMEERMKVARDRFRQLDATIIVSHAIRAGDEATCMQLISDNEALRMRLDNQRNERTFCVVTSKVDDFDWERYLRQQQQYLGSSVARSYLELIKLREDLAINQTRRAGLQEMLAEADAAHTLAVAGGDTVEAMQAQMQMQKLQAGLDEMAGGLRLMKDAETFYTGLLAFRASQLRNARVRTKIQEAYDRKKASVVAKVARAAKKKQAGGGSGGSSNNSNKRGPPGPEPAPAHTLDVLPVSALAYWSTKAKGKTPKEGFPAAAYTGIPALRAWIRYAVVPARIRHGMSLLRRLDVLLHSLKAGFDMEQPALSKIANPNSFLGEMLANFQETLILNLQCCSAGLVQRMKDCNPLARLKGSSSQFRPQCRSAMIEAVRLWDCRNYPLDETKAPLTTTKPPEGRGQRKKKKTAAAAAAAVYGVPQGPIMGPNGRPAKIAWTTHLAMIRRDGAEYVSGGSYRARYDWMGGLARIALSEVVEQWEASFHHAIPREADQVRVDLEALWATSLSKIRAVLPMYYDGAEHSDDEHGDDGGGGYLAVQLDALTAIRDFVIDSVQRCMLQLVDKAKGVHPVVEDILAQGFRKAFAEARKMRGRGSFRMRQRHLVDHASTVVTRLVKRAVASMDSQIASNIEGFADQLEAVWNETDEMIRNHIHAMVRTVEPGAAAAAGEEKNGTGRQPVDARDENHCRAVNACIFKWETDWKFSDVATKMMDRDGNDQWLFAALPDDYLPRPDRFDELGLSAADEEERDEDADNENDLDLNVMPAPKRQRKAAAVVAGPCKARGGKASAGKQAKGKGKAAAAKPRAGAKKSNKTRAPRKPAASSAKKRNVQ